MSATALARFARWTRRGAWAGLVVLLLLPLGAWLADIAWSREVLLLAPHDPSVVALNRSLWTPGEPVAEIYGSPMSEPTRVLLPRGENVIHPEEETSLSLLPVAIGDGRPFQIRTLWWAVRLAEAGLGALTAGLASLALFARRRQRRALAARPA